MPTITKPTTDKLRHIETGSIMGAQIIKELDVPVISFGVPSPNGGADQIVMRCTSNVWGRVAEGTGNRHPRTRSGLVGCAEFDYILLTRKLNADEKPFSGSSYGYEGDIVCGVISIPKRYYYEVDLTQELGRSISNTDDSAALVMFNQYCPGSFELGAFPSRIMTSARTFTREVEKLDSIDNTTILIVGNRRFEVESIDGSEIIFRLRA